jgi:hypothetical protein
LDGVDLEYSDSSNGEVTNTDQQAVYIDHGGGAISSIRRSFAIPFSPHVSSYPSTLFDRQQQPPQSSTINQPTQNIQSPVTSSLHHHPNDFNRDITTGFLRRAGGSEERTFDDPSFDEPREVDNSFQVDPGVDRDDNIKNHRIEDYTDSPPTTHRRSSFQENHVNDQRSQTPPPPPPPLGLPVPPTNFGLRTNRLSGDLLRVTEAERRQNTRESPETEINRRSFKASENHPRSNSNFDDQPQNGQNHRRNQNYNNGHNNAINPVNPFLNPLGPLTNTFTQGLSPDLFSLFESPFTSPLAGLPSPSSNAAGNQDNLFQRRRLAINNVVPDIVHNGIAGNNNGGYNPSSYNYISGDQRGSAATEEDGMKWPKIFKFADGRINLNDFERDKKLGKIQFIKKEPVFDNVRRNSFLILHGGTYSK